MRHSNHNRDIDQYAYHDRLVMLLSTDWFFDNTDKVNKMALSPQVKDAVGRAEQYRKENGLPPLSQEANWAQEWQAEQLLTMYKLAMADKKTMGISLWDFSDKNAWNGNTGGVLDANLDPKISFFDLQQFVRDHDHSASSGITK